MTGNCGNCNNARPMESAKINTQGTGSNIFVSKNNKIIDAEEQQPRIFLVEIFDYVCPQCGFIGTFQDTGRKQPDHRCPFCTNEKEEWIMQKVESEPLPIIDGDTGGLFE